MKKLPNKRAVKTALSLSVFGAGIVFVSAHVGHTLPEQAKYGGLMLCALLCGRLVD